MRQYRVARKEPIVRFISAAIRASGGEVLEEPSPTTAPFVFRVRTPVGEKLRLVCYAFLANEYQQEGRPADEHRFQIKYGSEFKEYHYLHESESPDEVTLMLGCHLEARLFIAVDPAMHNPTWFSKSVEFKTQDLHQALDLGWHSWERDRVAGGRRKQTMPLVELNNQTESLVAFTPNHLLRFVFVHQASTGLETGERLLICDRLAPAQPDSVLHLPVVVAEPSMGYPGATRALPSTNTAGSSAGSTAHLSPLLAEMGLSADDLFSVIGGAFRLKVALRGAVAERHLENYLRAQKRVTQVEPLDEDGAPDFRIVVDGVGERTVECKNVLRRSSPDRPRVDFQKTRASKHDPCSRYYHRTDFDVLAACLHPVTEQWEFRFSRTAELDAHPKCPGRLSHRRVYVEGTRWYSDIELCLA